MRLQDKVCVVTGGAQGIGFACATAFGNEGAKILLVDIDADLGMKAAENLKSAGIDAAFEAADTSKSADVARVMTAAIDRFGGVDVMLCNAAIIVKGDILDLSEDDFDRVVSINLKGYFLFGQAAAKHMVETGRQGVIINMSSIQAVITNPDILSYAVCKGGVKQLTTGMALALADKGVRVNAIAPGSVDTPMFQGITSDPDKRRMVMSRTPMGRPADPSEIAAVAVFLASKDSSYITGETIVADGGRLGLNYVVPVKD